VKEKTTLEKNATEAGKAKKKEEPKDKWGQPGCLPKLIDKNKQTGEKMNPRKQRQNGKNLRSRLAWK